MPPDPPASRESASPISQAVEPDTFQALAGRLRAIASRARLQRWHDWTDQDEVAILAAARELEGIREALTTGMRQAFDIGREYGQGEELLGRLNAEIGVASARLARQAWGRAGARAGGDGRGDGGPDG